VAVQRYQRYIQQEFFCEISSEQLIYGIQAMETTTTTTTNNKTNKFLSRNNSTTSKLYEVTKVTPKAQAGRTTGQD
jgi:hypothetical protein